MHPGPRAAVAALVAAIVLLSGCTSLQVPYSPAPMFVPSSRTAPDGPGPRTYDLTGSLDTGRGLTATVRTELRLGNVDTAPDLLKHRDDWATVRLTVDGSVTVTNTAHRPNRAVGSVYYSITGAYPRDSRVCAYAPVAEAHSGLVGRLCWVNLGSATTYSYPREYEGPPDALAPQASKRASFGTRQGYDGIWLTVPLSEVEAVTAELREPVHVATITNGIDFPGRSYTFLDSCRGAQLGPGQYERLNIVGTTAPLTCRQLPRY